MKISSYVKTVFLFFFLMFQGEIANTNEKKEPPLVNTQQFDDWTLRCVEVNKKEQCEMLQTLTVNNTNLQYTLVYSAFKNKNKEKKEAFTLIVPLGVNLQKRIALRFDGEDQLNIPYAKCETFGCITAINNDTETEAVLNLFKKIQDKFKKASFLEIAVQGFTDQPIVIKTGLQGFDDARNKLLEKLN